MRMVITARHQLLRSLIASGPTSRSGLAGLTGLSKAAISAVSRELIDDGLIAETSLVYGQGRPSVRLAIRGEAGCLAGVSLREDEMIVLLADLRGAVLHEARLALPDGPEAVAASIAASIADGLAGPLGAVGPALRGIGIAVPGYVALNRQSCIRSTRLGWRDVPLAALVRCSLDAPVLLENDANALVRGLQMFGPDGAGGDEGSDHAAEQGGCAPQASFSLISVEEGIGCGHLLDGRILRGRGGGAGELAHAPVQPDGLPCRCGKRGCLDTVASLHAIAEAARQAGLPETPDALQRLAGAGQAQAIAILHAAGSALGVAAAQLIQTLDPGRLLIGTVPALADGVYGAAMRQVVAANVLPGFAGSAASGDQSGLGFVAVAPTARARGAAAVAAYRFLCGPGEA